MQTGASGESVCAVISSATTHADFPSLNYHLAQTSEAPQYHKQTAISACPQRGHKMEETYLDKKAPQKTDQGKEKKKQKSCQKDLCSDVSWKIQCICICLNFVFHTKKSIYLHEKQFSSSVDLLKATDVVTYNVYAFTRYSTW